MQKSLARSPKVEHATKPIKLPPSVHMRLRRFAADSDCTLGEAIDRLLRLQAK